MNEPLKRVPDAREGGVLTTRGVLMADGSLSRLAERAKGDGYVHAPGRDDCAYSKCPACGDYHTGGKTYPAAEIEVDA